MPETLVPRCATKDEYSNTLNEWAANFTVIRQIHYGLKRVIPNTVTVEVCGHIRPIHGKCCAYQKTRLYILLDVPVGSELYARKESMLSVNDRCCQDLGIGLTYLAN